jgi:hypothetical protein
VERHQLPQTVNNGLDVEAILRGAQQLRQILSEAQLRTDLANSRFCSSPTTAPDSSTSTSTKRGNPESPGPDSPGGST